MYNLHTGKLHFQRNVRGHLSSNFQVAGANSANSADGGRGATSTATVNTGRSAASTVLMTTWHRGDTGPETPDRGTQRTRTERLTGIEDKKVRGESNQMKTECGFLSTIYFNWKGHLKIRGCKKLHTVERYRWQRIFWLCSTRRYASWRSHINRLYVESEKGATLLAFST